MVCVVCVCGMYVVCVLHICLCVYGRYGVVCVCTVWGNVYMCVCMCIYMVYVVCVWDICMWYVCDICLLVWLHAHVHMMWAHVCEHVCVEARAAFPVSLHLFSHSLTELQVHGFE